MLRKRKEVSIILQLGEAYFWHIRQNILHIPVFTNDKKENDILSSIFQASKICFVKRGILFAVSSNRIGGC
jgi:hypothetical protein